MIIISREATNIIFDTVQQNLRFHSGYGSPPIHCWLRNVIEALKLIDYGNNVKEGNYCTSLGESLGDVFYSVRYVPNEALHIFSNFKFYASTIKQYIERANLSSQGVDLSSRPLFTSSKYKPLKTVNIGYGIECSEYEDGSIWLSYKGTSLNTQFDRMLKKFCKWKDGIYAIFEKDGIRYKLFSNGTTQIISENKRRTIRLTETEFKQMLVECITKIINEIA